MRFTFWSLGPGFLLVLLAPVKVHALGPRRMGMPELLLLLCLGLALFFLPTILAKRDRFLIFVLNVLGFTLITWIIAVVLAIQSRREARLENMALSMQSQSEALHYGQRRPSGLSAWVLTPLVACALLALMYLAVAYFRDAPHKHIPAGISTRSGHPKP